MRRLIAMVIIGLGIAIALYRLVKKENPSVQKSITAPVHESVPRSWIEPGVCSFGIQVLIAGLFVD
jgi:hypothetical protein